MFKGVKRRDVVWALGLIAIGLGFIALQHRVLADRFESERGQTLAAAAGRIEASIHAGLGRAESSVRALAALIEGGSADDLPRIQAFAAKLMEDQQALRALQWEPRVIAGDRAGFEQAWRARGLAEFELKDAGAEGLVPAGVRPVSYPILAGHAIDSVLPLGLVAATEVSVDAPALDGEPDFIQVATRAQAEARDAAAPRLSAVFEAVTPVAEADIEVAFRRRALSLRMPVYLQTPETSLESRRSLLQGFAVGFIALPTLLAEARELARVEKLSFELRDPESGGAPLYAHADSDFDSELLREIDLLGRRWELRLQGPPQGLSDAARLDLPALAAALALVLLVLGWLRARQRRERAIRELGRLRSLTEGLPIGLFQAEFDRSASLRVTYTNPGAAQLSGQSAASLDAQPDRLFDFLDPDERAALVRDLGEALRRARAFKRELVAVDSEGVRRLQLSASLGQGGEDRHALLNGVLEDVTRLRQAGDQLEAFAAEQSVMVESLPFGLLFAESGRITRANPALAQLLGFIDGDELEGLALSSLHPDEDDYRRLRQTAAVRLKAGKLFVHEWTLVRRDGEPFRARLVGRKLLDDANRRELWVVVDLGSETEPLAEPSAP